LRRLEGMAFAAEETWRISVPATAFSQQYYAADVNEQERRPEEPVGTFDDRPWALVPGDGQSS